MVKIIKEKIDDNGKITILTYVFSVEDIKEDGVIENMERIV